MPRAKANQDKRINWIDLLVKLLMSIVASDRELVMAAAKREVELREALAAPSPAAVTAVPERKKPGPKPGPKHNKKGPGKAKPVVPDLSETTPEQDEDLSDLVAKAKGKAEKKGKAALR